MAATYGLQLTAFEHEPSASGALAVPGKVTRSSRLVARRPLDGAPAGPVRPADAPPATSELATSMGDDPFALHLPAAGAAQVPAAHPPGAGSGRALSLALPEPDGGAGGGVTALAPGVRALMEHAFGTDFSTVRVHQGGQAEAMEAVAYAQGEDLYFAPGTYQPDTPEGRELIGHELAHVVQQRQRRAVVAQGKGAPLEADPGLEREADEQGARAARGERVAVGPSAPLGGSAPIQRRPTRWTEITLTSDGKAKWVPHKTQPRTTDERGPHDATGTGMHVLGTPEASPTLRTEISPKPGIMGSGGVRALRLGPEHPPGQPADPARLPHLIALDGKAGSAAASVLLGAPPPYVAELVLPAALGGDGSQPGYLVALPPDAAAELRAVHASLIKLVDEQKAWVTFNSWVVELQDAGTFYVASVRLDWMELDPMGMSVPGTTGRVTINVPTPSAYGESTGSAARDAPVQIGEHANRAMAPLGALRRHADTGVTFQTRIHWDETHPSGDGKRMVANPLGPDHKIGEEPVGDSSKIWNQRTAQLRAAAQTPAADSYVAGHLLNHHVGGPGNDPRNLAAIPSDANKAHLREVETTIKRLVNDEKAWVYYSVDVTQASDPGAAHGPVTYADQFICRWHQLDELGAAIPNTHGHKTIDIKAPSAYKSQSSGSTDVATEAGATSVHGGAARSRLAFDELVLDDTETLKHQRQVMAPLVAALQEMQLSGDFARADLKASVELVVESFRPGTKEKDALAGIAEVSARLDALTSTAPLSELRELVPVLTGELQGYLQDAEQELGARHLAAQHAADVHLHQRYLRGRAEQLGLALRSSMAYDSDAFARTAELARQLVHFAELSIGHMEEHRAELQWSSRTLRDWLGKPPLPQDTPALALGQDVQESFSSGLACVDDVNFAPGSPATIQDLGEDVLGPSVRGGSSSSTRQQLLHHMLTLSSSHGAPHDLSGYGSHRGLQRMTALLERYGGAWPTGVHHGNIAFLIELLAPAYASRPEAGQVALAAYYQQAPDEFLEVLDALEAVLR